MHLPIQYREDSSLLRRHPQHFRYHGKTVVRGHRCLLNERGCFINLILRPCAHFSYFPLCRINRVCCRGSCAKPCGACRVAVSSTRKREPPTKPSVIPLANPIARFQKELIKPLEVGVCRAFSSSYIFRAFPPSSKIVGLLLPRSARSAPQSRSKYEERTEVSRSLESNNLTTPLSIFSLLPIANFYSC